MRLYSSTQAVLADVSEERDRQRQKWGDNRGYNPLQWFAVLGEEFGEVAEKVTKGFVPPESSFDRDGYRRELTQVAAVAVAAIEELLAEEVGR